MSCHIARIRRARRAAILTAGLLLSCAVWPLSASAHGISGRASLPVPAWLFAWVAAIVLVVSFVLLSTMWSRPRLQEVHERRLFAWPQLVSPAAGAVGLALFALVIYAGFEGVTAYTANFDPTFIFVIFWVGVPLSSALLGDWFRRSARGAPSRAGVRWSGARIGICAGGTAVLPGLARTLARRRRIGRLRLARARLPRSRQPRAACVAVARLLRADAAWHGPVRRRDWSDHGDAFGGYFGLFARLAPLSTYTTARCGCADPFRRSARSGASRGRSPSCS